MFVAQTIKKDSVTSFGYYANIRDSQFENWILLPPGASDGNYFIELENVFPKNINLFSVDYPGRGNSSRISDNSVNGIATAICDYLFEIFGNNPICLLGTSYGTAITFEILKFKKLNVKEIILIAPGEFINTKFHWILNTLFIPAKHSESIRQKYREFILRFSPFFDEFPTENLKDIMEQWFGIMQYQIDTKVTFNIPAKILVFSHDHIIREGSLKKVREVLPNSVIMAEISDHELNFNKFSKRLLTLLFEDEIQL